MSKVKISSFSIVIGQVVSIIVNFLIALLISINVVFDYHVNSLLILALFLIVAGVFIRLSFRYYFVEKRGQQLHVKNLFSESIFSIPEDYIGVEKTTFSPFEYKLVFRDKSYLIQLNGVDLMRAFTLSGDETYYINKLDGLIKS